MAISEIQKLFKVNSKSSTTPIAIVFVFFLIIAVLLFSYDNSFKSPVDTFSEYPNSYSPPAKNINEPIKPAIKNNSIGLSLNNDLLPKSKNTDLIDTNINTKFTDLIGTNSLRDTRNANLQLRADPPITMIETGPFNKSTITADRKSSGLNIC